MTDLAAEILQLSQQLAAQAYAQRLSKSPPHPIWDVLASAPAPAGRVGAFFKAIASGEVIPPVPADLPPDVRAFLEGVRVGIVMEPGPVDEIPASPPAAGQPLRAVDDSGAPRSWASLLLEHLAYGDASALGASIERATDPRVAQLLERFRDHDLPGVDELASALYLERERSADEASREVLLFPLLSVHQHVALYISGELPEELVQPALASFLESCAVATGISTALGHVACQAFYHLARATGYRLAGRSRDASDAVQSAIDAYDAITEPGIDAVVGLCRALVIDGDLCFAGGELDRARRSYRRTIAEGRRHVQAQPDVHDALLVYAIDRLILLDLRELGVLPGADPLSEVDAVKRFLASFERTAAAAEPGWPHLIRRFLTTRERGLVDQAVSACASPILTALFRAFRAPTALTFWLPGLDLLEELKDAGRHEDALTLALLLIDPLLPGLAADSGSSGHRGDLPVLHGNAAIAVSLRLQDAEAVAYYLWCAATLSPSQIRPGVAPELSRLSHAMYRTLATGHLDHYGGSLARSGYNLGVLNSEAGEYEAAATYYREAAAIGRDLSRRRPDLHLRPLAETLNNLGVLLGQHGDPDAARSALSEALDIYRRMNDRTGIAMVLSHLSRLDRTIGAVVEGEDRERLVRALVEFLTSESETRCREIIDAHPTMLTDVTDRLLEQATLQAESRNESQIATHILRRLSFLRRCRALGLGASVGRSDGLSLGTAMALVALREADSPAGIRKVITDHPELLDERTDSLLAGAISKAREDGNEQAAHDLITVQSVLERWRQAGSDARFEVGRREVHPPDMPPELTSVRRELSEAISAQDWTRGATLCRTALTLIPSRGVPHLRAMFHEALGTCLISGPDRRGDAALSEGLVQYEQALSLTSKDDSPLDWARLHNNLATALRTKSSSAADIAAAIEHFESASAVFTRAQYPRQWAGVRGNLASAYAMKSDGDRAANVDRAIACCQEALTISTKERTPAEWARLQGNLGLCYFLRVHGVREANVQAASHHLHEALTVYTKGAFPFEWARTQLNIAMTCGALPATSHVDALRHCRSALEVFTEDRAPLEWALAHAVIGTLVLESTAASPVDAEEVAHHLERALRVVTREAAPEQWAAIHMNMAAAQARGGTTAGPSARALEHYNLALTVWTPDRYPDRYREIQGRIGRLLFLHADWANAHEALSREIAGSGSALGGANTIGGQQEVLAESARAFGDDAHCLLRMGALDLAVMRLEEGSVRLLKQTLTSSDADVLHLPELDRRRVIVAREAVRALCVAGYENESGPGMHGGSEALRAARANLQEVVTRVQATSPQFQSEVSGMRQLLCLAPPHGALVFIVVTHHGGHAFVLDGTSAEVTEKNVVELDVRSDDLRTLLYGNPGEPGWLGTYTVRSYDPAAWFRTIEQTTALLWTRIMAPIHRRLQAAGVPEGAPLVLIPQGALARLPLHAAWRTHDGQSRAFLDDYTISYCPSASALLACQQRSASSVHRPASERSLLAVVDSSGDLPCCRLEGEAVGRAFLRERRRVLVGEAATKASILYGAPGSAYLHFACHGLFGWQDPARGGLVVSGGERLTVADIVRSLNLAGTRLVTLSACESGLSDIDTAPEEFVGLPLGFLHAGAAGVVSTLWNVQDLSTMLLMERFYREHVGSARDPADALRAAQRWVRELTAEHAATALAASRGGPGWGDATESEYRALCGMRGNSQPFAHPFYWGAFTFHGA